MTISVNLDESEATNLYNLEHAYIMHTITFNYAILQKNCL